MQGEGIPFIDSFPLKKFPRKGRAESQKTYLNK